MGMYVRIGPHQRYTSVTARFLLNNCQETQVKHRGRESHPSSMLQDARVRNFKHSSVMHVRL